ncbi:MAG: PilZ domain-containing protein [Planctomycetota bacterium]
MKPQTPSGFKPHTTQRISRRLARDANPDARIRFRLLGHEAPEARWGRAADLGPGGTCLVCDAENEVGDHLALEIHVAGHPPMPALARVLRCEKSTDGFRCGLEFLWLEQTDQDCLTGLATQDDTPPPPPRF